MKKNKIHIVVYFFISALLLCTYWIQTPSPKQTRLPITHYSTHTLSKAVNTVPAVHFKDITLAAGIQTPHTQRSEQLSGLHESLGAGACAFDYNNDGWIDLLTLNGSGTTHFFGKPQWWQKNTKSLTLYRNNQDGTFSDVTALSLLTPSSWTMGCATSDLDNDGDQDIVISNVGENQLWRNNNNGTFTNTAVSAGLSGNHWSTSISFADINLDGLLDIYITNFIDFKNNSSTFEASSGYEARLPKSFDATLYNGQKNQLYLNQGNWTFTEVAKRLGIDNPQGRTLSSYWTDINNDRYPDLVVANGNNSPNQVFLNKTGKHFTDISTESRLGFVDKASSITFIDIDNTHKTHIFVATDHSLYPKLYSIKPSKKHSSAPSFNDRSTHYQLDHQVAVNLSHWGSLTADINLDGWNDLLLANGMAVPNTDAKLLSQGQSNTLLINKEGQHFINQSDLLAPKVYPSSSSRCVLSADFNNDGTPDIYTSNNNDLGQLLSNTSNDYQWLGIDLKGDNKTLFGTKVSLTIGDTTIVRHFGERQHFLCSGDSRLLFGLGKADKNQTLTLSIDWPNGTQQTFASLTHNQYYRFTQGKPSPTPLSFSLKNQQSTIHFPLAKDKISVIRWLIENNRPALAAQELRLLIRHKNKNIRLHALLLSQHLPPSYHNGFITEAISSTEKSLKLKAIEFIKYSEDELLSRWLLHTLSDNDADIACSSAHVFAHFFDEEEAFIVHKYTALRALIRLATSDQKEKSLCGIFALGKSEHYRSLQPLLSLLDAKDQDIRLATINALGLLKEKSSISRLLHIANSPTTSIAIRASAFIAIKQINKNFSLFNTINNAIIKAEENHNSTAKKSLLSVVRYAYFTASNNLIVKDELRGFIKQELLKKDTEKEIKKIVKPTNTTCKLLIEDKNITITTINKCLKPDIFYKIIPDEINNYLLDNSSSRLTLLPLITTRKERWARELILSTLTNKSEPLSLKIAILQKLPLNLPTGTLRELTTLYLRAPESTLALHLVKHLANADDKELHKKLLIQLKNSIKQQQFSKAILLSEALINRSPNKVMDIILTTDVKHD